MHNGYYKPYGYDNNNSSWDWELFNNNTQIRCKKTNNLKPRFIEIIKNFEDSAYGQIYKLGIKMFNDHKLHGIGMNNFTYLCKNDDTYKNVIKNYRCPSHPHNIYLQWLTETGIFGLIFFLVYLFFILTTYLPIILTITA